jgi:hypothetical protein
MNFRSASFTAGSSRCLEFEDSSRFFAKQRSKTPCTWHTPPFGDFSALFLPLVVSYIHRAEECQTICVGLCALSTEKFARFYGQALAKSGKDRMWFIRAYVRSNGCCAYVRLWTSCFIWSFHRQVCIVFLPNPPIAISSFPIVRVTYRWLS